MTSPATTTEPWQDWIQWSPNPESDRAASPPTNLPAYVEGNVHGPPHPQLGRENSNSSHTLSSGTLSADPPEHISHSQECGSTFSISASTARDTSFPSNREPSHTSLSQSDRQQCTTQLTQGSTHRAHLRLAPKPDQRTNSDRSLSQDKSVFHHYSPYKKTQRSIRVRSKLEGRDLETYRRNRKAKACAWCRLRKITVRNPATHTITICILNLLKCSETDSGICPVCLKRSIPQDLCVRTKVKELDTHGPIGRLALPSRRPRTDHTQDWPRPF